MAFTGFGTGAVAFFDELAADNNRGWWLANKDRYEDQVRAPLEHLLADLADEFGEARVFRPYRDTRFSADKTPYKTHAAAAIGVAREVGCSLYLHLSADGLMTGAGLFHPAKDQLTRLREAIDDDGTGKALTRIVADVEAAGGEISGPDALKTAPRGYAKDHPRIDLLRMKGIVGMISHRPGRWLSTRKARTTVAEDWRRLTPINEWFEAHVGASHLPPDRPRGA